MITVSTITAICSLPISKSVGYFLPLRYYDIFLRYLLLVGELGASLGKWVLRDHLPAALDYPRVTAFCYSINQPYRPAPLQTLIWRCLLRVPALYGSSQPHLPSHNLKLPSARQLGSSPQIPVRPYFRSRQPTPKTVVYHTGTFQIRQICLRQSHSAVGRAP